MTHIIFECGDNDRVIHQSKLIFLWAMIHNINIDRGLHFMRYLTKVVRASAGNIIVRGLITPITLALGYNVHGLEKAMGTS